MIQCKNLTKLYGNVTAVKDINLIIKEKEFVSILGPSGCGKSSLLRLIAGLDAPSRGQVFLNNKEISGNKIYLAPEKRQFGMIFQDFTLFPHLSIKENVFFGVSGSKKEKYKRVEELLNLVNLPHVAEKMPHQISGGEQQRIAVARALAANPRLILMDEPFSNLDYQLRQQLRYDIRTILRNQGVATILVTHDQIEAITFSERILLMKGGELIQTGTSIEIYQFPKTLWASSFVGEANQLSTECNKDYLNSILEFFSFPTEIKEKTKIIMVRPEDFIIKPAISIKANGVIKKVDFMGPFKSITVKLKIGKHINVTESPDFTLKPNDSVKITAKRFLCFNASGERIEDFP